MGYNCLTKLSVTSQTLWPPPAEDLCCLMLRRRHSVYVYILWYRAVFTHGGWAAGLDRNRVCYHIHHTHRRGNGIKNTTNYGKIKWIMWKNLSEKFAMKMKIGRSWYLSSIDNEGRGSPLTAKLILPCCSSSDMFRHFGSFDSQNRRINLHPAIQSGSQQRLGLVKCKLILIYSTLLKPRAAMDNNGWTWVG